MSNVDYGVIAERLTKTRIKYYQQATDGDLEAAIRLYDWNTRAAGALQEDLGRVEVIFRNAVDSVLVEYSAAKGWEGSWYRQPQLFHGKRSSRMLKDIKLVRHRATHAGRRAETHSRVIAALGFGFWRYLCDPSYLTSLWVPATASAFPMHPESGNPKRIRGDVADIMQRLHFLRNRIAHHEPIHRRDLFRDHKNLLQLIGWICTDSRSWIMTTTRTPEVLNARP